MKTVLKVKLASLALLTLSTQVDAANWLMLQGTQPETVDLKELKYLIEAKYLNFGDLYKLTIKRMRVMF